MMEIKGDWREVEKHLRKLKRVPDVRAKQKLDRVLEWGLRSTQEVVHIETGSLLVSGRADSTMLLGRYSGTISYGGPSMGINNPVDYAVYELDRGGDHDFMSVTRLMHPLWIAAIKEIISK